jgi:hypothetical protein
VDGNDHGPQDGGVPSPISHLLSPIFYLLPSMYASNQVPSLIPGGRHVDARGSVSFVNGFDFKSVDRFYWVQDDRAAEELALPAGLLALISCTTLARCGHGF